MVSNDMEVSVIDWDLFDDNIYGEDLKVEFVSRIRAEQKFSDLSALIDQINCDKKTAWRILTDAKKS